MIVLQLSKGVIYHPARFQSVIPAFPTASPPGWPGTLYKPGMPHSGFPSCAHSHPSLFGAGSPKSPLSLVSHTRYTHLLSILLSFFFKTQTYHNRSKWLLPRPPSFLLLSLLTRLLPTLPPHSKSNGITWTVSHDANGFRQLCH